MKHNIFLIFLSATVLFSCSKDKQDEVEPDKNAVVGSWRASEFRSDDVNNSNVNLGAEILAKLSASDCYILTYTFKDDLTLTSDNGVNYLDVNAAVTGLDVPCPMQRDTEASTYTYDGVTLKIVDQDGEILSAKASIDGEIMTVDASDLDIPNLNGDGSLIFEKY